MLNLRADLHIHTYYSDGLMSPAEVVAVAKNNGVRLIAVTDHDCMLAYPEVKDACGKNGLTAVNGIEISAYENGVKVHTLGYNLNADCADFKSFSGSLFKASVSRMEDILYKLNKNGVRLSIDEVLNERKFPSSPIHAMYIARAASKKGYGSTPFAFYVEYLAQGKCAYSDIGRPSPECAVELIAACGGFSSLAHPARIEMEKTVLKNLVKKLKACGLGGIEGVYSTHTVKETAYYKEMASAFNLFVTGGSDTHINGGKKIIGSPVFHVDKTLAQKLGVEIQ